MDLSSRSAHAVIAVSLWRAKAQPAGDGPKKNEARRITAGFAYHFT